MLEAALTFVQCSDTHVVGREARVHGVDTAQTLARVVDAVNALAPAPAFVVVSGDLASPDLLPEAATGGPTDADYEAAYAALRALLGRLAAPVHLLLGNHDRRGPFRRVVLGEAAPADARYCYVVDAGRYRLCALDSLDPGRSPGRLGAAQLAWLRARLAEAADRHALIVVHHHPVPVGVPWLDAQRLTDADALWEVVRAAGNVRAVLAGHVHLAHEEVREGVRVLTTPSTGFQIARTPERRIEPGPPAFRVIRCRDGHVDSQVVWLA